MVDKRGVLIKPSFRVSEVITNPQDPEEMRRFLLDYQLTYAAYVREARDLAREASKHPIDSVGS